MLVESLCFTSYKSSLLLSSSSHLTTLKSWKKREINKQYKHLNATHSQHYAVPFPEVFILFVLCTCVSILQFHLILNPARWYVFLCCAFMFSTPFPSLFFRCTASPLHTHTRTDICQHLANTIILLRIPPPLFAAFHSGCSPP